MMHPPNNLRSWAAVNLGALERNLKAIRQCMPDYLSYISVVKADAYGHGLAPVVTRLMRASTDAFAVANLDEAARLREVGTGWPILILSVLLPEEYEAAIRLEALPVLSSREEIQHFGQLARKMKATPGVHLKIDTGMGRLGVWYPEFAGTLEAFQNFPELRLEGLCTHFAAADSDPEFTATQRSRFLDCLSQVPLSIRENLLIHADNSAGFESFPTDGAFNAVRVGLIQFGIRPSKGSLLEKTLTEPVLSFHTRVGLVKELPEGMTISYGRTQKLKRNSRIAILTAGYADGLSTGLSNRGKVLIQGHRCPLIGRVTMDQTMVDVTDLPQCPEAGDSATFIGQDGQEHISATEFALDSGQIEWEAFCSLTARTTRIYSTDSAL